jgi:hypothetical protein
VTSVFFALFFREREEGEAKEWRDLLERPVQFFHGQRIHCVLACWYFRGCAFTSFVHSQEDGVHPRPCIVARRAGVGRPALDLCDKTQVCECDSLLRSPPSDFSDNQATVMADSPMLPIIFMVCGRVGGTLF